MSKLLTVAQLCDLKVEQAKRVNRKAGHDSYECHSRLFKSMWGERQAETVTRTEIEEAVRNWRPLYAAATIRHRMGFLGSAYNYAIDNDLLLVNPVARMKQAKIGKRHQWLTHEQEAAMKKAYLKCFGPEIGEFWWSAERFAILTGCRIGEQAHLQARHVSRDVLTIPEEGKTGTRPVPMHPEAYSIALHWIEFSGLLGSPYVFFPVAGDRNVTGRQWVIRVWNVARKEAGLQDYQNRDRRRTFGSRLIRLGSTIYQVMLLLGHSNVEQTRTYCQVDLIDLAPGVLKLT